LNVTTATDKQGSAMVRWAAVESVQRLPKTSRLGAFRDQVADRRGRNIGIVAAARRQVELVYYALRDHHVRALRRVPHPPSGQHEHPRTDQREVVLGPDPRQQPARSIRLIDPTDRSTANPIMPTSEGMNGSLARLADHPEHRP
jgi:hypothetical protein